MDKLSALSGATTQMTRGPDHRVWHALRGKFHTLLCPSHLPKIESWYNRFATTSQRVMMRDVFQGIHAVHGKKKGKGEEEEERSDHLSRHLVRLYGDMFTDDAKRSVRKWLGAASEPLKDSYREICSAINASGRIAGTANADIFAGRQPTDLATRRNHIFRVNWESKQTMETIQQRNKAQLEIKQAAGMAAKLKIDSSEIEEDPWAALDRLVRPPAVFSSNRHAFNVNPLNGVTEFICGAKKGRECVNSGLPLKMGPDTTSGWLPTSVATFKAMRPADILYCLETTQQPQAAIVRVTASNGVVIPRLYKSD